MIRATFRANQHGQLVTFDSTGADKAEAFRRGQEWGQRAFGHVELVVYETVHEIPTIGNVRRFAWDGSQHRLVWSNGYYVSEEPIDASRIA